MSDIERFKKHNKKQSTNEFLKTKDVDFDHLVPSYDASLDDETRELLFDDLVDPATKHKNYLEEQNCKEKTYKFIMFLLAFLGIIIGLVTIRYDLIKIISYFFHASN